jgi:hypothetical protein
MIPDPYRHPATHAPGSAAPPAFAWYDVAVAAALAFLLGVARVAFALARGEPPSREVDLAWLLVMLAPLVVWKEIAARRRR